MQNGWMGRVERVMSLLAFSKVKDCLNYELTTSQYKNRVADEVNSYLLQDNSCESLKMLLNLGKWCENKLDLYLRYPHLNPWGTDLFHP
jgi:hypothetical protein